MVLLKVVQLSQVSESYCIIWLHKTPGWDAYLTIAVTKEPALVQVCKARILVSVGEKSSEYMLMGELLDKQYTMVIW